MRLAFGVWLFAQIALLTCGHQLREPEKEGEVPEAAAPAPPSNLLPPSVDSVTYGLQRDTAKGKISALKTKTVFAANTAQASAAEASVQKMKAEEVYMHTMEVGPELSAIQKYATSQADLASEASKESEGALKNIEKASKSLEEESKQYAVQEVKTMLRGKYDELSDWRNKVLTVPYEDGRVAATKAAAPYFDYAGKFAASIGAYDLEAGSMRSQAATDAANSKDLAAGVDAKMESGDVVAAWQDREMAAALATQSKQLADRAATLNGQAAEMRNAAPQYGAAAHSAAISAEYAANPDGVPPPPVDPNFAFASPLSEEGK